MRALGALVCLLPSLARADVPQANDRQFLDKAYSISKAGVELGKLAQHRAASPAVRENGARLASDHQRAVDTLEPAAKKAGLTLPTGIQREESDLYTELRRLRNQEFDKAFSERMAQEYQQAISLFENQARHGQSRELSRWAEEQLPVLKQHESIARRDRSRM